MMASQKHLPIPEMFEEEEIDSPLSSSVELPPPNSYAKKRPRAPDEGTSEELLPELADFFDDFETPVADRICICRAYASYLASLSKKSKRKK